MDAGTSEDFIRNGDKICLFCEAACGFLSSDGITSTSLVVERLEADDFGDKHPSNLNYFPNHFERCVFTLSQVDIWGDSQGLGQGRGDALLYGQVLSLRHDYTNSTMTVNRKVQSSLAVGCTKVLLEREPVPIQRSNERCVHFKILPRYKVRSEGDRVRRGDQILLKAEKEDRYLHVTEESTTDPPAVQDDDEGLDWRYEVNMSAAPAEWTVHVYETNMQADTEDTAENDLIHVGMPVALFHKEREGFVSASVPHTQERVARRALDSGVSVYLNIPTKTNQRVYNIESLPVQVNSIWMFEKVNPTEGGIIKLAQGRPKYRIKHLASHRYLAVVLDGNGVATATLIAPHEFKKYAGVGQQGMKTPNHSSSESEEEVHVVESKPVKQGETDFKIYFDREETYTGTTSPPGGSTEGSPKDVRGGAPPPFLNVEPQIFINGINPNNGAVAPESPVSVSPVHGNRDGGDASPTASSGAMEISLPIPVLSSKNSIKRMQRRQSRQRLYDQTTGRAQYPEITHFYIHPLDEGQTIMHSATTFTKMQHVLTKRWVQVQQGETLSAAKKARTPTTRPGKVGINRRARGPGNEPVSPFGLVDSTSFTAIGGAMSDGDSGNDAPGGGTNANAKQNSDTHADPPGSLALRKSIKINASEKKAHDDVWCTIRVGQDKVLRLNTVIECKAKLQAYSLHCETEGDTTMIPGLFAQTKMKLEQLIMFCHQSDSDPPSSLTQRAGRAELKQHAGLPNQHNQELLFSQDIHKVVIRILKIDNVGRSYETMQLGKLCYLLLRAMIRHFPDRATELLQYISIFERHMSQPDYNVCDMLLELFRDNQTVLDHAGPAFVERLKTYIVDHGMQHAAPMELLGVLCVCNGQAVPKNQGMVLGALRTTDVLVMDTIVNSDGAVWVQVPTESRARGARHTGPASPMRRTRKRSMHREEAPVANLRYGSWVSLGNLCSSGSPLVHYYTAMIGTLGNLCIANPTALLDVQKWLPSEVLEALLGYNSRYWTPPVGNKESGILYDIQAKAIFLAIHAHIIPHYPEPPQNPSRLVIAWHDIDSTFERPKWRRNKLTTSLKAAGREFLLNNRQLVYSRMHMNRLISAWLVFWQEIIQRNLFEAEELDEVLESVSDLLDGGSDMLDDNLMVRDAIHRALQRDRFTASQSKAAASAKKRRGKTGLRSDSEESQIAMFTKVHAIQVFVRKIEYQAVEAIASFMKSFRQAMDGVSHTRAAGGDMSDTQLPDDFESQFEAPILAACNVEAFQKQNEKLIPICLDLASYDHSLLSGSALTFIFKSMWFGNEIAAYLHEAQILFNAESWVLFKDLTQKKKQLTSYLLTITQGEERTSADSPEEVACRAIIADLGAKLNPSKAGEDAPTGLGSASPTSMRRTSRRPTPRARRGSMMRTTPATRVSSGSVAGLASDAADRAAALAERQDICRNLVLHELIANQILTLPINAENAKNKDGRWELVSLSYRFLRLFCEDHPLNPSVVAPLVLPHFLDHLDLNVGATALAQKLFCDARLAAQVPPDIIKGLVAVTTERCVRRHESPSSSAELLKTLVVSNDEGGGDNSPGRPVPRNQRLCMDYVLEKVGALKLHDNLRFCINRPLHSPPVKEGPGDTWFGSPRRTGLGPSSLRDRLGCSSVAASSKNSHMMDLCKIVELIALCCQGRNKASVVGAQSVLSLKNVLGLIFQVLQLLLDDPPPRPEDGASGMGSAEKDVSSWTPPQFLVCTLLQFLHNVYLEEGDDDNDGDGDPSSIQNDSQDKKFNEWSSNANWWGVFACFTRLVREGREKLQDTSGEGSLSGSQGSQSDLRAKGSSGSLFLAPTLTPQGSQGMELDDYRLKDLEVLRAVVFKHALRCVETFLTRKFWESVPHKHLIKLYEPIIEFFDAILALSAEAVIPRLTPFEVSSLQTFFQKLSDVGGIAAPILEFVTTHRGSEKRAARSGASSAGGASFTEAFEDRLVSLVGAGELSSPRKADEGDASKWEQFVYERFCRVQMHLLDTFTEDTLSLTILLRRLRCEMNALPEHGEFVPPPWLTALVHHLVDDPDLPEQVICGSLKVFTKLIVTATLPLDEVCEECDDEIEELTPAIVTMQNKLNRLGLTSVMVKLSERGLVGGEQCSIANDAISFGVALLHGGNKRVQDAMLEFFLENDECFFESMKDAITMASEKLQLQQEMYEKRDEKIDLGSVTQVLRLLQLCSEGHHFKMQNYIRHQEDNLRSSNVVREVLLFLRTLLCHDGLVTNNSNQEYISEEEKEDLLELAGQTFDTLTEFCQGPCPENQNEVVGCNICHLVDLILQSRDVALLELKSKAISTLLSVLEGCSSGAGMKIPPTVSIMLRHKLIDNIQHTIAHIWDDLKERKDEAGTVFHAIDAFTKEMNEADVKDSAEAAAAMGGEAWRKQEEELIEQACEVLDVVQSLEETTPDGGGGGASLCDLLDVSFNLYILLMTLSNYSSEIEAKLEHLPGNMYFKRMVGTIEIARGSSLEKVYFRIPATCSGLSKPTKLKVLWDLRDKESRAAKLGGFFELSTELIAEMKYLHEIRREVQHAYYITSNEHDDDGKTKTQYQKLRSLISYKLGQFFTSPASQDRIRRVNVLSALLVNTLLLLTYSVFEYNAEQGVFEEVEAGDDVADRLGQGLVYLIPWMFDDPGEGTMWDDLIQWVIHIACIVNLIYSVFDIYFWWNMRLRRVFLELKKREEQYRLSKTKTAKPKGRLAQMLPQRFRRWGAWVNRVQALYEIVPRVVAMGFYWRVALVVISFAAMFHSPFYSALHLLSVIPQSSHLRNVVSAVSLNGQTLLMTFAFGVLVIYLFSVVGYIAFHHDFLGDDGLEKPNCVTLLQCFTFTLMNGMRSGGGVGDILSTTPLLSGGHHTERLIFDYLFFVGVTVILLGIVSGIITDSFTELRKRKDDFEEEMRNYCFICGIETSKFERYLKGGMARHTRKEHNMWNYLYFHHHLLTKQEDEFTGQESFVWERIQERDFSFYPINRSMSMLELGVLDVDDGNDINDELRTEMGTLQKRVVDMETLMQQMSVKLTQLNQLELESLLGHLTSKVSQMHDDSRAGGLRLPSRSETGSRYNSFGKRTPSMTLQ